MSDIQYVETSPRYSKAVIHGDTVYLAGQVADDPGGTVQDQMRQILAQIDALLARCGTDKSRLLSAMVLLKDMRDLEAINPLWDAWVTPGRAPTRTPSEARLALPGYLVEVQVTAAR